MEPLRKLIQDPSADVRMQALAHLTGRNARGMVVPIGDLLHKEEDSDVQHEALLLGRIGSLDAIALLKEYAAPGGKVLNRKPVPLPLTAVRALAKAGPAATDALAILQDDEAAEVRAAAPRWPRSGPERLAGNQVGGRGDPAGEGGQQPRPPGRDLPVRPARWACACPERHRNQAGRHSAVR